MRKTKKQATSPFNGVSLKNGQWLAQYKAAGFYQRYETEMEALAHYLRVYCHHNGRGEKSTKTLSSNRAWLGRIAIGDLLHYGSHPTGGFYFQFPVDRLKEHVVRLDERDYESYKDLYWFVRDNRVTGVSGVSIEGGEFHFYYEYLDSMIFSRKNGTEGSIVKPVLLNKDPFNLTRRNLESPHPDLLVEQILRHFQRDDFDVESTGMFRQPKVEEAEDDSRWEQRQSFEEESWPASFAQNCGETSDQTTRGNEIIMPR